MPLGLEQVHGCVPTVQHHQSQYVVLPSDQQYPPDGQSPNRLGQADPECIHVPPEHEHPA